MRLRLIVQRPELPPVKLLWDTDSTFNPGEARLVSTLVSRVNDVFPLLFDRNGLSLESYVVELGGFECLHFQPVDAVFKDGDEVVIRNRTAQEIRAAKLSGRYQTSSQGRYLLDGQPFGSQFRESAEERPAIRLPARKRVRIEEREPTTLFLGNAEEQDEEEDELEVEEEEEAGEEDDSKRRKYEANRARQRLILEKARSLSAEHPQSASQKQSKRPIAKRRVSARLSSEEDDASFAQAEDSSDDSLEYDSGDDDKSGSSDESSGSDEAPEEQSVREQDHPKKPTEQPSDSSDESSEDSDVTEPVKRQQPIPQPSISSDEASSESDVPAPPRKKKEQPTNLPHQATRATKARNQRKHQARKLEQLKDMGVFGEDITVGHMKTFLAMYNLTPDTPNEVIRKYAANPDLPPQPVRAPVQDESSNFSVTGENSVQDKTTELNRVAEDSSAPRKISKGTKKAYKKALTTGKISQDVTLDMWVNKKTGTQTQAAAPSAKQSSQADTPPLPAALNIGTYGRSNKKWKNIGEQRPTRTTYDQEGNLLLEDGEEIPAQTVVLEEGTQVEEDPDAWRSKIVLSAVECELEGLQLPTPDFPFHQSQLNWQQNKGKNKKRKRTEENRDYQQEAAYPQNDNLYEQEEPVFDASMYDDPVEAPAEEDPDFSPMPTNLESLPALMLPVQVGTVFAFKRCIMDATTWCPIMEDYKQAKVIEVNFPANDPNDVSMICRIPKCDVVHRQYDEETGERIYGKFEMPGTDDDLEEDQIELFFLDLLEPKIISTPESDTVMEDVAVETVEEKEDGGDKESYNQEDPAPGNDGMQNPEVQSDCRGKEDAPEDSASMEVQPPTQDTNDFPDSGQKMPKEKVAERKVADDRGTVMQDSANEEVKPSIIPEGAENCLAGLSFVFSGKLPTLPRQEGQQLVRRYGGETHKAPSAKTSFVVLGDDVGAKKLGTIERLKLRTIGEEGLFELIRKPPANGGDEVAAQEKVTTTATQENEQATSMLGENQVPEEIAKEKDVHGMDVDEKEVEAPTEQSDSADRDIERSIQTQILKETEEVGAGGQEVSEEAGTKNDVVQDAEKRVEDMVEGDKTSEKEDEKSTDEQEEPSDDQMSEEIDFSDHMENPLLEEEDEPTTDTSAAQELPSPAAYRPETPPPPQKYSPPDEDDEDADEAHVGTEGPIPTSPPTRKNGFSQYPETPGYPKLPTIPPTPATVLPATGGPSPSFLRHESPLCISPPPQLKGSTDRLIASSPPREEEASVPKTALPPTPSHVPTETTAKSSPQAPPPKPQEIASSKGPDILKDISEPVRESSLVRDNSLEYDTDSDGFPSLRSMIQSQSVKPEPKSPSSQIFRSPIREPSLPPIPNFSPLMGRDSEDGRKIMGDSDANKSATKKGFGSGGSTSESTEAKGKGKIEGKGSAKREKKKLRESVQMVPGKQGAQMVKMIDLTSSP